METVTLESPTPSEILVRGPSSLSDWREQFACKVEGAEYSPLYRRKDNEGNRLWDGIWRPGQWLRPTSAGAMWRGGRGFLSKVLGKYRVASHTLVLNPRLPVRIPENARDYQRTALEFIAVQGWGRIALATNAGKGAVIALLAEAAKALGFRSLVICDEVAVFDALRDEIKEWTGIEPGLIREGVKEVPQDTIVLAMLPTLAKRIGKPPKNKKKDPPLAQDNLAWRRYLESVHMVLADEADKCTSETWQRVLGSLVNTLWRAGFSGTFPAPGTQADYLLEECLGPVLVQVKNQELVARRISARPEVTLHKFRPQLPHITGDEWKQLAAPQKRLWVYENGIVRNPDRHLFIRMLLMPDDLNVIIVNRIEHGKQLLDYIPDSQFVSGDWSPDQRNDVLDRFGRKDFQNLIVTKILDRGSNRLGVTVGLVFASGEGSDRQVLQRIGRGLRRTGGKEFLFLRDVIDRGHRFLNAAAQRRVRLYNAEGFYVRLAK